MHEDVEYAEDEQPRVIYRPNQVSAAAVLMGAAGGTAGLLVMVTALYAHRWGGALIGALVLCACVSVGVGLWYGYRGAQWVTVGLGVLGCLSGLRYVETGQGGLVQIALSAGLIWLVVGTARAREWFS